MIEVEIAKAKTRLSRLVKAAGRGEQVFLKQNGIVVAEIMPVLQKEMPFGFLKDQVGPVEDSLLFSSGKAEFDDFMRD